MVIAIPAGINVEKNILLHLKKKAIMLSKDCFFSYLLVAENHEYKILFKLNSSCKFLIFSFFYLIHFFIFFQGGHIFVFLGALNLVENDDQLAIILAHEMSHELLNHSVI